MRCALWLVTLLMVPALSGCGISALSDRRVNPLIYEQIDPLINLPFFSQDVEALGMTPERRLTIFKRTKVDENRSERLFCSEPSPDVAESLAYSFQLAAEAAAEQTGKGNTSGALNFGKNLASQASQLFVRTQGLQFFRDASFQLCQMYLNGVFGYPERSDAHSAYLAAYNQILASAGTMITTELQSSKIPIQTQRAEATSFNELLTRLEKLKALSAPDAAPKEEKRTCTKEEVGKIEACKKAGDTYMVKLE